MSELAIIAEMRHPGHTVPERRTQLGWTQAELAQRADVAQADISRIENSSLWRHTSASSALTSDPYLTIVTWW